MRIASGVTDQYIYFVAVDSTDLKTREPGLTTFTVYRSRNGGAATAMTTPTVAELDATNMMGDYSLLLDEDMTIAAGNETEEMLFHITQADMAPVTRAIELYRPKITAGNTLGVAADGDVSGNLDGTVAVVTTLTGHTAQTGDNYARIGATGSGLTSLAQASLVTAARMGALTDWINDGRLDVLLDTVLSRLTAARAGYLDNLNIGGNVAGSSEVLAIQNNTRCVRSVPTTIERPDSGTSTYRIELLLYDDAGDMEAPDSAPTIVLVDQDGTDLNARLDSPTMTLVSTGRYRAVYTATNTDDLEQLIWAFSVIEGGNTRIYGNTTLIVDTTAVDFTAADRTKLDTLHDTRITAVIATKAEMDAGHGLLATEAKQDAQDLIITEARLAELDAANIPADIDTLLGRITATIFSGITSVAEWLGLLGGKQTGNATARTELRATGAGSGTYDETTDSGEALRDTTPMGTAIRGTDNAATEAKQDIIDTLIDELKVAVITNAAGADVATDVVAMKAVADAIKLQTDDPGSIPRNGSFTLSFLMVDETDRVTPEPGLTVTGTRSIDKGAFGAVTGVITEIAQGFYVITGVAADSNGTEIIFRFTASGAADRFITVRTSA